MKTTDYMSESDLQDLRDAGRGHLIDGSRLAEKADKQRQREKEEAPSPRAARTYGDDWADDYLAWLTALEDDFIIEEFGYERGEFDWADDYLAWLTALEDDVIIEEFGYERGEFAVFPESWRSLYEEGLSPRDAWQRALDAHGERQRQEEIAKQENWARIQREDAELLICCAIGHFFQKDQRREED